MADEQARRKIIDRANRLLKQSKTLRKMADELLAESADIRTSAKQLARKGAAKGRRRA